jgi:hypothetical protein
VIGEIMNLEFSEIKLYNPGVLKTKLPASIFADLTRDLQLQVNNNPEKYNSKLAGQIETELEYVINGQFKDCIEQTFLEYRRRFDFYLDKDYIINNGSWVNFQKKHEYNPIHFHYQDISWVIWISIPYDLQEELNMPNVRDSNYKVASKFQFIYNSFDGGISTTQLDIDKTWEGSLIMFPNYLKHQVYPFQTSDEHRISISGNIEIKK